jgi:hypothetical protein
VTKTMRLASFLLLTLACTAAYGEPLQTQMAMTGDVEVDVVKAKVQDGILTLVLAYRNNGTEAAKIQYLLEEVYYIDETEKKKYQVLRDSKDQWIAAPVARGKIGFEAGWGAQPLEVPPGGKKLVWFKFPAPAEGVSKINLVVPDVLPFENLAISR